jgi:hypothetical protein
MRAPRRLHEAGEERRIVEQRIDPLLVQRALAAVARRGAVLRDERQREGHVFAGQSGTDVRQDHRHSLQSYDALLYPA